MKPDGRSKRWMLCAPLLLLLSGGASLAAVSFDVAVGMNVDDDSRIFLNVTNEVWHPPVAATVIQRCEYPEDDFPVVSFLAFHSHRDPSFILNLRSEGYRWSDIFFQLNVNPSVLFVGINRDPGPPYGKAWGYWKQRYHPGARERFRIADRDIVGLVKVQTASRHFGTSPFMVIDAQRQGRHVEAFTANRWREKHGRKTWGEAPGQGGGRGKGPAEKGGPERSDKGKDQGQGRGKGQGKGHGHGRGHGGGD